MQIFSFKRNKTALSCLLISTISLLVLFIGPASVSAQDTDSINALRQMGKAFAQIAEKASPAVVGITAKQVVTQEYPVMRDRPFADPFFDDDFFEHFFGPHFRRPRSPERRQYKQTRPVLGSGFIISDEGYILTNNHVVKDAEDIEVKLADGRSFDAKIIGADPDSEVAVIKIDADNLSSLEVADSDNLEVGEWVIAIGNPFGLNHTVTAGIVSAKGRSGLKLPGSQINYQDFIQTDAAINPGNSGGPLINLDGKVVGINTAILGPGSNIGIGFAVPINMAKFVYDRVVKGEPIERGALGISIDNLDPDKAESLGLEDTKGAIVVEVFEKSAAEKAGLKPYDVIIELNGERIENANELQNRVGILKPGTEVQIVLVRNGERKTLTAELGERSEQLKIAKTTSEALEQLGLTVQNLTDDLAERYGYEGLSGVVVTSVEPDSEAARAGIQPGMLIMEVNRKPVKNVRDFNEVIEETGKGRYILFLVDSERGRFLVTLRLPQK